MQTPDILHPIQPQQLSPKDYFRSLTAAALDCGLLTESRIGQMYAELPALLAALAERQTQGQSSSVSVETAESLAGSVMFVLGVQLKSYPAPEQAAQALQTETMETLFTKGLSAVRRKMAVARHLQRRIADNLLHTPNVFYRATAIDGINGFFRLYQPQFAAQLVHITLDYPILSGRPPLDGIECIEAYLRDLEIENSFCVLFDAQDIHNLLCGLTRDYRSCPMNLFEPVLLSALGLMLCGRSPRRLDLTEADVAHIARILEHKSAADIQTLLENALSALAGQLPLPLRLSGYAARCFPFVAADLAEAAKLHTLHARFLVPKAEENEPQLTVSYGETMADEAYKKLLEGVLQAENSDEKIRLIVSAVHSLADLTEIVSDAALDGEEMKQLVTLLPPAAFAALLMQYPNDDFLERESEQRLYCALQHRKAALTDKERQELMRYRIADEGM